MLLRLAYSLGNIPYATLTARITAEPQWQVRLTGDRMQGAAIGGLLAALVYLFLPLSKGVGGVPLGAIILGIAAQPLFLLCWKNVRERVTPASEPGSFVSQLRGFGTLLRGSPALRRLLGIILLVGLACTILNKGLLFVFDQLDARGLGYVAALFPPLVLFVGAPMWTRLATAKGRVFVLRGACLLYLVSTIGAWLAGDALVPIAALMALAAFASVGMSVMFFALVPGVIEACERELAQEGCAARVFGLANLSRKLAQAIAPQVIAFSLLLPTSNVLTALVLAGVLALGASLWIAPKPGQLRSARAN
jgi:Na+/melibiose symporter-like transporter